MSRARRTSAIAAALGVVALLATACSSDSGDTTTTATTAASVATTSPGSGAATTTTTAAASTSSKGSVLAGTWSGDYNNTTDGSTGTFVVRFEGSSPNYTGSITIPGQCDGCPITATVTGNTIGFGSVGGQGVTYDGTISGKDMSGTYTVGTGQSKGTWSATKQ
jgi:hypothetical protein